MPLSELKALPLAELKVGDKTYPLAVYEGSEAERALDVTKLRAQTGLVTLDTGYMNTGACKSAITFLDGEKGILRYRGYPIEMLAERSSFLETAYLLIFGELPTARQLEAFQSGVVHHTMLHEDLKRFYDAFPRDAHPMALLSAVVCSLSTFYQDSIDPMNPRDVELSTYRLIGKIATIAAYSYKKSLGHPFVYPDNSLDYAGNFLRMMFSVPAEKYEVDPFVAKALDQLLILHADHEQNCSTSTVRMVGSSQANLFASVSAGICALWGPLHGGANQAVLEMLQSMHREGGDVGKYVTMAKDKGSHFRLMGFGHRVYKNFDPRAQIIKRTCHQVLERLGVHDPLLDIALKLEATVLADPYFIERKLYPNVDFYSGIIYRAMGFPTNMFTVLFGIGRMPGWIAHWREMMAAPDAKISRPRQVYAGERERAYLPVGERR